MLQRDQCVGDGILMRPVLAPLTVVAFFMHNLHNNLHVLVHMLQVRDVCLQAGICHYASNAVDAWLLR